VPVVEAEKQCNERTVAPPLLQQLLLLLTQAMQLATRAQRTLQCSITSDKSNH